MTNHDTTTPTRTEVAGRKRAVIFVRASSRPYNAAREYDQIATQRQACEQMAERLGAAVARVYIAHGGTTDRAVRDVTRDLLEMVDRQRPDYLVVSSYDRLTRKPDDLARIAKRLTIAGADLVTTTAPPAAFLEQVKLAALNQPLL